MSDDFEDRRQPDGGDRRRYTGMTREHVHQTLLILIAIGIPCITFGGIMYGSYSALAAKVESHEHEISDARLTATTINANITEVKTELAKLSGQVGEFVRRNEAPPARSR